MDWFRTKKRFLMEETPLKPWSGGKGSEKETGCRKGEKQKGYVGKVELGPTGRHNHSHSTKKPHHRGNCF